MDAAVTAMSERGYHATSMREIANQAGMSVANVYHYFASKHAILFRLMDENAQLVIDTLEDAIMTAGPEPHAQLLQATMAFASMHTTRRGLAFVTTSELRALEPDAHATVVQKRRRIEKLFVEIIAAGRNNGVFNVEDVELSARMLLDMTRSIAAWYQPTGRLDADQMCREYARVALVLMQASKKPRPTPRFSAQA